MPFPVDKKYIEETQKSIGYIFPDDFVQKMIKENGGEIKTDEDRWHLFPFFDKSDRKRISRTSNHIEHELKNTRHYETFPANAVPIGGNGCGDYIVLTTNSLDNNLLDDIFIWRHDEKIGELKKLTNSISNLIKN